MLRNGADLVVVLVLVVVVPWRWGGMSLSDFPEKSVTKVNGSMLLALRGGGWVSNIQENSVVHVTLELLLWLFRKSRVSTLSLN